MYIPSRYRFPIRLLKIIQRTISTWTPLPWILFHYVSKSPSTEMPCQLFFKASSLLPWLRLTRVAQAILVSESISTMSMITAQCLTRLSTMWNSMRYVWVIMFHVGLRTERKRIGCSIGICIYSCRERLRGESKAFLVPCALLCFGEYEKSTLSFLTCDFPLRASYRGKNQINTRYGM